MAKELIFLVHGMGDTTKGWSKDIQVLIRELYGRYDVSRLMSFDDLFVFEEINYNGLFDAHRERWKEDATAVIETMKKGGLTVPAANSLAKAAEKPGDDSFFTTHVLDVLMYRFMSTVAEEVRRSIDSQILKAFKARPANDAWRWSIIAHSLGTSVTHDVLHQIFSSNRPASWGALPSGVIKARVMMMVANVSRLLEDLDFFGPAGDVYASAVRPSADKTKGACEYYLSVRHEWDPIPKPKMFRPADDWPDPATRALGRFESILINAIEQPNVHDFAHYLRNPRTHIPLFRRLTVPALIPDDEWMAAISEFEAATPLGKFESERKALEKLSLADNGSSWPEIIKMLQGFAKL